MNFHSLRLRMAAWYAGVLTICLVIFGAAVYLGLARYLDSTVRSSLRNEAQSIGEKLMVDVNRKGDKFIVGEINEMAPEISGRFIRITRQDGSILYQSPTPINQRFVPARIPLLKNWGATPFSLQDSQAGTDTLLIEAVPFVAPEGNSFLIEVGASAHDIRTTLHGLVTTLALGVPLIIAIAALGGILVMKRALHPLDEITRAAETITSRNFGERLPTLKTGDEIERLTTSLNRMMSRLEDSFQHISRFSADVSHELRTPLTILRGELESLTQYDHLSPAALEVVGSALEEIGRLTQIVNQLLEISRLEAGQATREVTIVNLGEMAIGTAEQMRLLADEKSIRLDYLVSSEISVMGNASLMKQVVVNLLDNAIKYTPAGGSVELLVESKGDKAVLEVRDTGIGIPAYALPHICERFYRADKARTRHSGGAGLGLSIVKSICTAQGGELSISSKEGEGTRVRIEMPRVEGRAQSADSNTAREYLRAER
ncbi:MAG: HAMP domain-containing protein [Acidobacteria bacterium]|nr:HAMP domain-containing protein [Acidobacteriota bacterium]